MKQNDRVKLLILLPQLKQGGAEGVVRTLVESLDKNRFEPSLAWFHGECHSPFSELKDIPMYFLNKKPGFDPKVIWRLVRIIISKKIMIVNAHHFMPLLYAYPVCKLTGSKVTHTEHSVFDANHDRQSRKKIAAFIYRTSNAVIGVSPEVTDFFENKYQVRKNILKTIVNGIDTQIYKPREKNVDFLKSIGIDFDTLLIGMTGNLRKLKNHKFLIQSFIKVLKHYQNTRLILIGQGFENDDENSETELKHIVSSNSITDKVFFLGYRTDVHQILNNIDIFCLTSLREGLPLSLIEAMASGIPVVGTNVQGIKHVIHSGQNGFLVPLNDIDHLTYILCKLISNKVLRKKIAQNARLYVEQKYDVKQFVHKYETVFQSLVKN